MPLMPSSGPLLPMSPPQMTVGGVQDEACEHPIASCCKGGAAARSSSTVARHPPGQRVPDDLGAKQPQAERNSLAAARLVSLPAKSTPGHGTFQAATAM